MILDSIMEEKAFFMSSEKPKLNNLLSKIERAEQLHRIALQNLSTTHLPASLNVKADPSMLYFTLEELKRESYIGIF